MINDIVIGVNYVVVYIIRLYFACRIKSRQICCPFLHTLFTTSSTAVYLSLCIEYTSVFDAYKSLICSCIFQWFNAWQELKPTISKSIQLWIKEKCRNEIQRGYEKCTSRLNDNTCLSNMIIAYDLVFNNYTHCTSWRIKCNLHCRFILLSW